MSSLPICSKEASYDQSLSFCSIRLGTLKRQVIISVSLFVAKRLRNAQCLPICMPSLPICSKEARNFEEARYTQCFSVCSKRLRNAQCLHVCSKQARDFEEARYTHCLSVCSKESREPQLGGILQEVRARDGGNNIIFSAKVGHLASVPKSDRCSVSR